MLLGRQFLRQSQLSKAEACMNLPERVIQFGTGVLLRGLPGYFIDKANRAGIFNGRIVVVKSTGDDVSGFEKQDCIYTHLIAGIQDGKPVTETIINTAISRVLSARKQWQEILRLAGDPAIRIVISNTTEAGLLKLEDRIENQPPQSYPGKLLAWLVRRFTIFSGSAESGMVIIPTELVSNNGYRLKEIILELAYENNLGSGFIYWLDHANLFCNSLVDRIVPGKPPEALHQKAEREGGYEDELMIMSEPYALWAIESDSAKARELLCFAEADERVIICPDIMRFRELKLRILNGAHSFSGSLAFLAGFHSVYDAVSNPVFYQYLRLLIFNEIIPALELQDSGAAEVQTFARNVLDRFSNPFIIHEWLQICAQSSRKIAGRGVPLMLNYIKCNKKIPPLMTAAFAAHFLLTKERQQQNEKLPAASKIKDDFADCYSGCWNEMPVGQAVNAILSNQSIWGTDLSKADDFAARINHDITSITRDGIHLFLRELVAKQS